MFNYPELEARLEQVLGCAAQGDLSVLNLKLHHGSAMIELRMSFVEGSIPPNFQKKAKNCLIFYLYIPDFRLDATLLSDDDSTDRVETLSSKCCVFKLGRYRYQLDAKKIHFDTFQSVNEMDLVDQEW